MGSTGNGCNTAEAESKQRRGLCAGSCQRGGCDMCERLQGRTQTLRALKYGRRCGGSACMRSSPKECVVCSHDLWKATPAMGVCTDQSKCKHSGESRARTGPLHSVSSAQCQGELQRCCHPAGAARFEVEAAHCVFLPVLHFYLGSQKKTQSFLF